MTVDYEEGDWFAVPLPDGGYGAGLIARAQPNRGGVLLGYFFGPRLNSPPGLDQLCHLKPAEAVLLRLFGHLDVRRGRWPVIGRLPDWNRDEWPMPALVRRPALGPAMLITRSDVNPNAPVSETVVQDDSSLADAVPEGLVGSGLMAKLLARDIDK